MPAPISTGLIFLIVPLIALVYMINPALGEQLKQVFESTLESFMKWTETDAGQSFLQNVFAPIFEAFWNVVSKVFSYLGWG